MLMQRLSKGRAQAVPRPRDSFNSGFVIYFTKHATAEGVTSPPPQGKDLQPLKPCWLSETLGN